MYADGGSRGNPGDAAYGAVLLSAESGEVLAERADYLGIATNNVAEYSALVAALEYALGSGFIDFLRPALTNLLSVTKGACYVCMRTFEVDGKQVLRRICREGPVFNMQEAVGW